MSRLIDQLKRRNVPRAAILYVGVAWVILQVVDVVGQILKWPDGIGQFVLLALAAGFPVAMLLSWFYLFTASGIHAETDAIESPSTTAGTRRQSDKVIIAVLSFALALFVAIEIFERIDEKNVDDLIDLGRKQLVQRTDNSIVEAEETFRRAIEIKATSAEAYAGLAETLMLQFLKDDAPTADYFVEIQAAIDKGRELDHELGALYAIQGTLKWARDNDLEAAETLYLQAIELSPDDVLGYRSYAELLAYGQGKWEEALPQVKKGLELLPNDPDMVNLYANAMRFLGSGVEALPVLRESVQLHDGYLRNYVHVAEILKYEQGQIGESLKWTKHIVKQDEDGFKRRFLLECWAWMLFQDINEVSKCTSNLEDYFKDFPKKTMLARLMYYDATGDKNKIEEEVNALMSSGPAKTVMQRDSAVSEDVTNLLGAMIPDVLVDHGLWELARDYKEWRESPIFTDSDWEPSKDDVRSNNDIVNAIINGAILYKTGDQDHGDKLFELALDKIRTEDLSDRPGFNFRQILVLAVRGDKQGAVAYLRVTLVDKGYFEDWHRLRNPVFELVADNPEWKKLLADLETRAAAERERYEENKDEPLFSSL